MMKTIEIKNERKKNKEIKHKLVNKMSRVDCKTIATPNYQDI